MLSGHLLKIVVNGELVAEAPLYVYDAEAAGRAFGQAWTKLRGSVEDEIFDTVRVGCDPVLLESVGLETGLTIDLEMPVKGDVDGS